LLLSVNIHAVCSLCIGCKILLSLMYMRIAFCPGVVYAVNSIVSVIRPLAMIIL
jgi:hypothetical protein